MRKKILFVHHSGQRGGAPRSLSYLLRNISLQHYEVKLVNVIRKGPINEFFSELCKEFNIKFEIFDGIKPFHGSTVAPNTYKNLLLNLIYFIPSVFYSIKLIRKENPQIIHLNSSCLFPIAIACRILNKRINVIIHVREPMRSSISGNITSFFVKRFCDGIISISKFDLDSFKIENSSKIKSVVIHNFVDEEDIYKGPKKYNIHKSLGINRDSVIFLYLGRFASSNGVKNLISVAESITRKYNLFHFVLAGAINDTELGYSQNKNIHILPFQKNIKSLLSSSDVFICPFTEPHFSRGIIEASYSSIPIISSNIGCTAELVINNDTGFLYNSNEELKNYIILLGSNAKMRLNMGKSAYSFAEKEFNLKSQLKKTYGFIDTF